MDMRFIIPATMLAGALALAGCGGGSDTPAAKTETTPEVTPAATSGFKPVNVEGGVTLEDDDEGRSGSIETGVKEKPIIGNLLLTCPESATNGCRWRVKDGQVEVTGGAIGKRYEAPMPEPNTTDRTAGGGEDAPIWLSDSALIGSVKRSDTGVYVEIVAPNGVPVRGTDGSGVIRAAAPTPAGGDFSGADAGVATSSGSDINHIVVDTLAGRETDLRLVHTRDRSVTDSSGTVADKDKLNNDYLVFGAWERRTSANEGPKNPSNIGQVATGSIKRPDPGAWKIGDASYEGKALGHYSHRGGAWKEWDGTVHLEANFAEGNIQGEVTTGINIPEGEIIGPQIGKLTLKKTSIAAMSSGSAAIPVAPNIRGAAASGTWKAEYFGSAVDGAPSGVAGSFASSRPEVTSGSGVVITTHQTAAEIQGAFGAHNVGPLPEGDQGRSQN